MAQKKQNRAERRKPKQEAHLAGHREDTAREQNAGPPPVGASPIVDGRVLGGAEPWQTPKQKYDTPLFATVTGVLLVPLVFVLQANGVVTIGWLPSLVIYVIVVALFGWAFSRWEVASRWKPLKRYTSMAGVCMFLSAISAYGVVNEFRKEHLPISLKDISDFSSGIVASIGEREYSSFALPGKLEVHKTYAGTGVFVRDDWYLATCAKAVENKPEPSVLLASFPDIKKSVLMLGSLVVPSKIVKTDAFGLAILKVQTPIAKMNSNGHDFERSWVPRFEEGLPQVGQRIFVYGVESGGFSPSFSVIEGHVTRIGSSSLNSGVAIFSTLPFRSSFCGAPVLNEAKAVIGLMMGSADGGDSEITLARYIVGAMKDGGISKP
jgi:hypothetical protein